MHIYNKGGDTEMNIVSSVVGNKRTKYNVI